MRTVKQYWNKKRIKKTFNEQWETLLNNVVLPITQRIETRTIAQDLISVQPMQAPPINDYLFRPVSDYTLSVQDELTEKKDFTFWRIKIIFNKKYE